MYFVRTQGSLYFVFPKSTVTTENAMHASNRFRNAGLNSRISVAPRSLGIVVDVSAPAPLMSTFRSTNRSCNTARNMACNSVGLTVTWPAN